jgi:hypothetical protein
LGRIVVNAEPGQRLLQRRSTRNSARWARGKSLGAEQARLQREDLVQPFHILPRHRQHPQNDARSSASAEQPGRRPTSPIRREQRAGENGSGERVGAAMNRPRYST